ncbi:MAG TPA: GDSL-type esterase/lipase family protein [Bacteroidia bacterium]|nr:GDSL-type esterase/lipase family protein [Bacteroidia bacterium]
MNPQHDIHGPGNSKLPEDASLDRKGGDVQGHSPQSPGKKPPETAPPGKSLQPQYVLGFVAAVIAVLGLIALVFPDQGIKVPALQLKGTNLTVIPGFTAYFPTWKDFFEADTNEVKELDDILAALGAPIDPKLQASLDTTAEFRKAADMKRPPNTIQYPNDDPSVLFPAFEALEKARQSEKPVRILHYGDSQIEGDRMSGLFRARIQEKFGGSGPGLVAGKPLTSSMSVVQDASESMRRYAQYGVVDKSVKHRRYGAMAIFSRFAPIIPDSAYTETETHTGWISIGVPGSAYATSKNFSKLKMYYGFNRSDVNVKVFLDDVLHTDETFPANKSLRVKTWSFSSTPKKIMIIMEGFDSPDIYGLSLESNSGVALDNISMRGSSGTTFASLESMPFKPMLDSLNPKLLLLQYGGNTVPYIKDKKAADNYGRSFKAQIEYLKGLVPGAAVIVIGPGDMSTKVEGEMQTYPNLIHIRDALRQAAFDAGAGFFDIYEAMGGHNSMITWVEAEPALAAADYVHFSPQGAKIIAEAFIKSFMADYEAYHQARVN